MALFANIGETKFKVGDVVSVYQKVEEEGKSRNQIFEGVVLGIKGHGAGKSFTIRKIGAGGIGIERIFHIASPVISKIEVKRETGTGSRRSKLYYLRGKPKSYYEKLGKRASRKGTAPVVKEAGKSRKSKAKSASKSVKKSK